MLCSTLLLYFGKQASCYVLHFSFTFGKHASCYVLHCCFFGKHASCYVLLFSCTSVSTLHATFITAKTVRKLKRWKRIAGAVASRGICHMFISWRCLLAPAFHGDLWKKTLFYCSGSLKMHVELHKFPMERRCQKTSPWYKHVANSNCFHQDEHHHEHENWWKRWSDFRAIPVVSDHNLWTEDVGWGDSKQVLGPVHSAGPLVQVFLLRGGAGPTE